MLSDDRYDAIVAGVYAAAQGEKAWGDALSAVVDALGCWSGHLMGFDRQTGGMAFSHEAGAPPAEATLDYILRWHRSDPRNAVLLTAAPETWVHCHEHLSEAFVRSSDFYQQFLIPYGSRYVSGMHFSPGDDLVCILSFQRGVGREPFGPVDRESIARIGRHVRAAFLLEAQTRQQQRQAVAGHAVLTRLRYPVLLVDEHRTLLYENAAATAELKRAALLVRRGSHLALADRAADAALTAAIHAVRSESGGLRWVRLEDALEPPALLHVASLLPEETMRAFGTIPVVMLTLFHTGLDAAPDPFLIAAAFGLTPAEARVAAAAAEGLSDQQVADRIGTSAFTVRTQIRSVYAKTGALRRADLVRLLNSSPGLWTGGLCLPA